MFEIIPLENDNEHVLVKADLSSIALLIALYTGSCINECKQRMIPDGFTIEQVEELEKKLFADYMGSIPVQAIPRAVLQKRNLKDVLENKPNPNDIPF